MAVEAGGRRGTGAQQQRQLGQQLRFGQRVAGAQTEQQRLATKLGVRVCATLRAIVYIARSARGCFGAVGPLRSPKEVPLLREKCEGCGCQHVLMLARVGHFLMCLCWAGARTTQHTTCRGDLRAVLQTGQAQFGRWIGFLCLSFPGNCHLDDRPRTSSRRAAVLVRHGPALRSNSSTSVSGVPPQAVFAFASAPASSSSPTVPTSHAKLARCSAVYLPHSITAALG